jgi:phenylacetate-CoA ligase
MPIWNPRAETMQRQELRELQLFKLKQMVRRTFERVPFYREKLERSRVSPDDIRTLDDIRRLPFTVKDDLRDHYPFGLFAVPMEEVVRVHASSGTTGRPTVVGYTRADLDMWSECVARFASAAGVTPADRAHVSFGYGLFTGGFGLHYGLEKIGAAVIPVSSGNTARQFQLMKDFGATTLIGTPSYALHMIDSLKDFGIDPKRDLRLKIGLFGAEPWSESIRREIEKGFCITATDNYGLSEVIGPGVAGECQERCGMHICEDHFFVEVLDPKTMEPVREGETGELVITPLSKEALPLMRYRTKDLSVIDSSPCSCGRTMARVMKIRGRTDDMLIIRGVNVFPSQIEEVLLNVEGVAPHYQIVVDRKNNLDTMEVRVEVSEGIFFDEMKRIVELEKKILERIYAVLGIHVKLKLVEPKTIERSTGKAHRVMDMRDVYGEDGKTC